MPTSHIQPIRLLDPGCWYKFTFLMANSEDPDQLASSAAANWSGSTQDQGWLKKPVVFLLTVLIIRWFLWLVQFLLWISSFICGICLVIICSSSLLLLVPWVGCASCLWHFLGIFTFCIQPNYCTHPYKHTVELFRSLQITASVLFVYFFIKAYVVGTNLNCIDLEKNLINNSPYKAFADICFKGILSR